MIDAIDALLNRVTMYRLAIYCIGGQLGAAFLLGFVKLAPVDSTALAFSGVIILATCWGANRLFEALFDVPANTESFLITALILTLIMPPVVAANLIGVGGLILASFAAIASKFLLAVRSRHLFNPVALGVALSSLALDQPATWWIGGNLSLAPIVIVGGCLIVRKVQRFDMLAVYIGANLLATLLANPMDHWLEAVTQAFAYSPLLFAGFIILTEPMTAPQGFAPRLAFAALTGALSSASLHIGDYYFTPEVAFLVGNLFAFAASPQGRLKLTLLRVEEMAAGCYDFVFATNRKLAFEAGQYLDWTLRVANPDDRGNRRPFTIASAPAQNELRMGVKFNPDPSAYKLALAALQPGDVVYAQQLAGDFTLPADASKKLAFIAGGIGVTPFRSILQQLVDTGARRPVILLYGNNRPEEIAYADLFTRAQDELGIRTVYIIAENAPDNIENVYAGFIDADLIKHEIPDYAERMFYLSGPRAMVMVFQRVLRELGVARSHIKIDYFPGFA